MLKNIISLQKEVYFDLFILYYILLICFLNADVPCVRKIFEKKLQYLDFVRTYTKFCAKIIQKNYLNDSLDIFIGTPHIFQHIRSENFQNYNNIWYGISKSNGDIGKWICSSVLETSPCLESRLCSYGTLFLPISLTFK